MDIFGAVILLTTGWGRQSLDRTNAWILLCLKPPALSDTKTSEFPFCLSHFELGILSFATEGIMAIRREEAEKLIPNGR